ncbi:MAG: hypothetical protein ACTSWV_03960, partial [Candidatus Asgardarchaeia archaeon]
MIGVQLKDSSSTDPLFISRGLVRVVSYSTTEVGSFTPLNSGSLRSTAPESEPHDVFRAGSPQ